MKSQFVTELPVYSAAPGRFDVVTVPPLQFLMIDGHGDPNTATSYAAALATLYPVAYSVKFLSKKSLDRDYAVMPLEALWWSDEMESFTTARDKSRWSWTVMTMLPEWITAEQVDAARAAIARKGTAPALADLRFELFDEGLAVQTLHVGPFDAEAPVLEELHSRFIPSHGLQLTGRHHEIYLSDPRRAAPEKLRTILRQPVDRA